jgi:fatty acid desaturase
MIQLRRAAKRLVRPSQLLFSFGGSVYGVFGIGDARSTGALLFWTGFTGFFYFSTLGSFHEAAHQTLFRSRGLNVWFGRAYGTMIGLPYTAYRTSHALHHANLLQPGDWEFWPYCDPGVSLRFRRVFVWVDLLLGPITGPYLFSRVYHSRSSPLPPRIRRVIAREYLASLAFWTALLVLVSQLGAWHKFLTYWIVPFWIAGSGFTFTKFMEHLGRSDGDAYQATRTVLPDSIPSALLARATLLISHLGLHHRYPHEPVALLHARSPGVHAAHFTSHFAQALDTLRACLVSPGGGRNVKSS